MTTPKLTLLLLCALIPALSAQGQITLYNGELAQAVTTNSGAATWNYDAPAAYALLAYNSANVTYVEESAGTTFTGFGSGTVLKMTNNGGVDGALRYAFTPANVDLFAGSRTAANEGFLFDMDQNPTMEFDVIWDGTGGFGTVIVDMNSNTTGAGSFTLLNQALTANTATPVSVDMGTGSAFQDWVTAMGNADPLGNTAQLRIVLQTGTGTPGTFAIDNIRLTPVPEPSTFALLAGFAGLGLALLQRRRKASANHQA